MGGLNSIDRRRPPGPPWAGWRGSFVADFERTIGSRRPRATFKINPPDIPTTEPEG